MFIYEYRGPGAPKKQILIYKYMYLYLNNKYMFIYKYMSLYPQKYGTLHCAPYDLFLIVINGGHENLQKTSSFI